MKNYYAAECTSNPIWLIQRKGRFGQWETIDVATTREIGQDYLGRNTHHYGQLNKRCRVYAVHLAADEELVKAVYQIKKKRGDIDEMGYIVPEENLSDCFEPQPLRLQVGKKYMRRDRNIIISFHREIWQGKDYFHTIRLNTEDERWKYPANGKWAEEVGEHKYDILREVA